MLLGWDPRDRRVPFQQKRILFTVPFQAPPHMATATRIQRCEGRDANDRKHLKPFQHIAETVSRLWDANRPIIFRLRAKYQVEWMILTEFLDRLQLEAPMWVSKWTRIRTTGMLSINMVAEPKSADVWPETVELEANQVEVDDNEESLEYSDFSLTARGFLRFADCKILCERTFPFFLQHDGDEVRKAALVHGLWHRVRFQPNIRVFVSQQFPTDENAKAIAADDVDGELLNRLFAPLGVPRM
jgi:hypothetical protein